jgi:hypothetical protein
MAWEQRSRQRFYYRKRRVGRRVVSEYLGAGPLAELNAWLDAQERQARAERRQAARAAIEADREAAAQLEQAGRLTESLARAALLLAGYHAHKGQWRRPR